MGILVWRLLLRDWPDQRGGASVHECPADAAEACHGKTESGNTQHATWHRHRSRSPERTDSVRCLGSTASLASLSSRYDLVRQVGGQTDARVCSQIGTDESDQTIRQHLKMHRSVFLIDHDYRIHDINACLPSCCVPCLALPDRT